jgi:acetolactate synthase-1/2/3 large subunit
VKFTGGQMVVRALEDEAIQLAFGIPGTHNIELYDAMAESRTLRPVLVTDEQSAGFMADAVWRSTGQMACANLVPGAGLTHALSGVAEAFMDGIPMLVLGCGIRRDTDRAYQLHDIDQLAIAAPITKGTFRPASGAEIYGVIRRACALARSGCPGPVMVEIPVDHYLFKHEVNPVSFIAPPAMANPPLDEAAFARAVELLSAPDARPLLYLGLGALGAGAQLVTLAERLGAPVATTIQGKGVFPESHPLFLWNMLGAAAPPFVRKEAERCTVMLAIGCRFGEVGTGSYGFTPPATLIHGDIEAAVIGRNFPAAVGLHADAAEAVVALLSRLPSPRTHQDPDLRARIAGGRDEIRTGRRARTSRGRVTPAVLLDALQRTLGPDTVFTSDSGNGTFLAMELLQLDHPRRFLAPVDYSCMGYSVPAAIAAKLARPEAPVVALAGDGAFLMTGLELLTAANQGAAVAVFVLRDRELAQIAQFQATAFNRKAQSVLPDYEVAGIAAGLGIECLALDRDADIERITADVQRITGEGRPVLVDTAIDYSEKTFFTRGVVSTNLGRLPWPDRLRFVGRALGRRLTGG